MIRQGRKAAFTLIEIVVAIVILAFVLSAVYSFVHRTVRDLREVTRWAREGREGPALMAQIERDLGSIYIDARMENMFSASDELGDAVELRFVTSRNSTMFINGVQSDLTEVGYRLDENDEEGSVKLHTLYRREEFLMDEEPLEGGLWIPLADNVVSFEMFFYELPEEDQATGDAIELPDLSFSGGLGSDVKELDEWSEEDRYLPFLVKIILRVDSREPVERAREDTEEEGIQTFTSLVRLPPFPRNLEDGDDELQISLNIQTGGTDPDDGGDGDDGSNPPGDDDDR